ncbi:PAS domain S-box protein [Methylobacterium bullatum]|uniref:Blue-light-activated histidine kinase n=1 Tax=Methylobacterium bullatum TaxID=570505 RepID=A0A679K7I4_9HYPH|nr:Blue-light-activated histidine kinase [Methylobacterium bullatum]
MTPTVVPVGFAGLDEVSITDALVARPVRPPDYEAQAHALAELARELAVSPDTVLQRIADLLVGMGLAGSAGISILEPGEGPKRVRRAAIAGSWAAHRGGTIPFAESPCGLAVTRNTPLLFSRPHARLAAASVEPPIQELLLVPFHAGDEPVGTLWVGTHDLDYTFDGEDLRLLTRLTHFASAACVMTRALDEARPQGLRGTEASHRADLEREVRECTAGLQRSRDLLQTTLDSSMDMIQVFEAVRDASGEIVDFRWRLNNHTAERTLGEVRGQSLVERSPGVVRDGIFDAFRQVVETGLPSVAERRHAHGRCDGWFHQSVVKLGDGVATTTREMTAWKEAHAKLEESEAKYRHLFNSIDEGVCIVEMMFDDRQRPVDYRFLSVNPAFDQQTGLGDATGRTMRDLLPELEANWFETFGRIARNGVAERFERRSIALGRWYEVYAFRVGTAEQRQVALLFKDIQPRKRAEAALRESEERFRAFVTASSDVVYRMTPDWSELQWLEGRAFKNVPDQPSRTWLDRYIRPDDQAEVRAAIDRAMATRSIFELEHAVIRSDGSLGWCVSRAVPTLTDTGEIREWLGAASDVTARRNAETALRESEERLSQFGEASSDVLWMRDAATFQWIYLTPAFETIYGLDRTSALAGDHLVSWAELIVPDDRERAVESLHRVRAGERVTFEYRVGRPGDGGIRWIRDTGFPMRDAAGAVCWIGGVGRDITEEKETAEHMSVLVAELQHRTRNLMGVVRATADKTLRNSSGLDDFRERYGTRLAALARVQGLLSRLGEGERVSFDELIRSEVAALDGEASRVSLSGPKAVALRSSTVQIFALALHELATNALKYGALAQPQAHLEIRWHVELAEPERAPWLHVDWRERGVRMPARDGPPQGRGSGRELIERALPYQLGARTTFVMEPDGVHCTIALPVSGHTIRERAKAASRRSSEPADPGG